MSKYNKEELQKLIIEEGKTYEEIGLLYCVTGNAIRKAAQRCGIELPIRRKVNPTETFNKINKKCPICGKSIPTENKYCSQQCKSEFLHQQYIKDWKEGLRDGISGQSNISEHIKQYLFSKHKSTCCKCGWSKINPYTGNIPLQVHHIDGNCLNNVESNLELLCPNCHSLTENYGSRNNDSKRIR